VFGHGSATILETVHCVFIKDLHAGDEDLSLLTI
jgi:hypothetical protein